APSLRSALKRRPQDVDASFPVLIAREYARSRRRLARSRDAERAQAIDERTSRDAEHLGGGRLVSAARAQRVFDALTLERGDGLRQGPAVSRRNDSRRGRERDMLAFD